MVEQAIEGIRTEVKETGSADVLKWWTLMATDVSSTLMFGESFNCLGLGKKTEYIEVLESVLMVSQPLAILIRYVKGTVLI